MTDAPRAPPETLADVRAGDEVILFPNRNDAGFRAVTVDRVTITHYIVGERRFWRTNGKHGDRIGEEVGGRPYRSDVIMVGAEADARIAGALREKRAWSLRNGWHEATKQHGVNQEAVARVRAACDRAEAALRELGEWNDV